MLHKYIVNTAGIVYNDKNQFIVIKRSKTDKQSPGIYAYPAGKVDLEKPVNNILEKNLRREVKEEAGVEITNLEYLHSEMFQKVTGDWVVIIHFIAKYVKGKLKAADPKEVSEVLWMTLEQINKQNTLPVVKRLYKLAEKKIKK